ncbi:hypothetical protein V2J09_015628 [Rumex salicifolius]
MAGAVKGAVGRAYPVENWSDERCGGRLRSSDSVLVGVVLLRSKIGAVTRAVNSAAVGFRRISQIHVVLQCITFLQVLVAAGAASVSIKFWDLKEAKRNSGRLVELRVEDYIEFTVSEYAGCAKLKQLSLSMHGKWSDLNSARSSKLGVISVSNHALRVPEGVFQNHWMLKAIARADQDHFDEGEAKESYSTKSMNLCHKEYDIYWAQLDRNHSKQGSHPEETTECEDLIYENLAHRLKRKRRLLQKVVDVAHVGCLDVGKGEVGDLVNPTPLAGPEDEVGGVAVGEDAVGEEEDVAFLKRVALVSPQLKVHRCRLISYQSQASLPPPPIHPLLSLLQHYKLCVYSTNCPTLNCYARQRLLPSLAPISILSPLSLRMFSVVVNEEALINNHISNLAKCPFGLRRPTMYKQLAEIFAVYDNLQSASNWYKTMYKQSEREPRTEARNRRKREIAREGKEMDLMEPLVAGELHNSLVTGVGTSVASVSWSEALEDRRLRFPDS